LQIKDLASELGVTEDTVINWEIRGRMPARKMDQLLDKFPGLKEFSSKYSTI
jgi:DNA-binding transcriptional regulator YiaG